MRTRQRFFTFGKIWQNPSDRNLARLQHLHAGDIQTKLDPIVVKRIANLFFKARKEWSQSSLSGKFPKLRVSQIGLKPTQIINRNPKSSRLWEQ